jgi:hypothetical protein
MTPKEVGHESVAALFGATQETQWLVEGLRRHFVCLHMPHGPNLVLPYGAMVVQDGDAVVVLPVEVVTRPER